MLKTLMLRKKLDEKKKLLEELRKKEESFATREAELEQSITEADTEEEQKAVEEAVDAFEDEKKSHSEQTAALEQEIAAMEQQISEAEEKQRTAAVQYEKRGNYIVKANYKTNFFGMSVQERDAFFADPSVKNFLSGVRAMRAKHGSISGAELTIPDEMLPLLRQVIFERSKLLKYMHMEHVSGKARQPIMGTVPEAVWTETCGKINELDLLLNQVEVDSYKVGGFFAVCDPILEDPDVDLASTIISALGQSIAYALDKAQLYGTGKKMPLGIVTRLLQTQQPDQYPDTYRKWTDLSETNVITIEGKSELAFFQELVIAAGAAISDYSRGNLFWAMNKKTHAKLTAYAMSFNAAGAIVSAQTNTLPVVGGTIEDLNFIPDDVIIGGYGDLYLLAERAGTHIASSEHVRFLEDQTVFKGTARYDGTPVIPEAFVAIGIGGEKPTAEAVTFAQDTANE